MSDWKSKSRDEGRPHLGEPKLKVKPQRNMVLWCPICDWRHSDSFKGRERLGHHMANDHYKEIAYPQGEEPDNLEEE